MSAIPATRTDIQTTPVLVTPGRQVNLFPFCGEITPIVLTPTSSNAEVFQHHFEKAAMLPMRVAFVAVPVFALLAHLLAPTIVTLPLIGFVASFIFIETVVEVGVFAGIVQPLIKKVAEFIIPYFSTSNAETQRELAVKITRVFTSILFAIEQVAKFLLTSTVSSFRGLELLARAGMGLYYYERVSEVRERDGMGVAFSTHLGLTGGKTALGTVVLGSIFIAIFPFLKVAPPPTMRV